MRFPRWLAGVGVVGGVAIALGLPWVTLVHGGDLGGAKVAIIILALITGACLAGISAVVGITVPTALTGAISLGEDGVSVCCPPECMPAEQQAEGGETEPEAGETA
jgi:hypothetical protein